MSIYFLVAMKYNYRNCISLQCEYTENEQWSFRHHKLLNTSFGRYCIVSLPLIPVEICQIMWYNKLGNKIYYMWRMIL